MAIPRLPHLLPGHFPRQHGIGGAALAQVRFEKAFTTTRVAVKESSDVAHIGPRGGFVAVGDLSDLAEYLTAEGVSHRFKLDRVKDDGSGLEGVAVDPSRNKLFVGSEDFDAIYRFGLTFDAQGAPTATFEHETAIPKGNTPNKGIEGLAFLPSLLSPTGQSQLLLVRERDPKQLMMLNQDGEGEPVDIPLSRAILKAVTDFSGLAVDPKTGHVFIVSDESAAIVEVVLVSEGGKLRAELVGAATPLFNGKKPLERLEGITFDEAGTLYVLGENDQTLYGFKRLEGNAAKARHSLARRMARHASSFD